MLLDLRARDFDQLAVLDARRARRFARAAVETSIDVRDEPLAQLQPSLVHQLHLANAPTRRIGFLAPQAIRWAMIQAKPAVNAARIVRVFGLIRAGEPADWAGGRHSSDPSHESAGAENAVRVEHAFQLLHQREIARERAPNVDFAFQFGRAPQQDAASPRRFSRKAENSRAL